MSDLREIEEVGEKIQYIVIKLGDERYGIDIKYVDNIVRMQQITRVPKVEHYLKGVINIRGEIVPVMSLRVKMDLPEDEVTTKTRIIILHLDSGDFLGIIVDQVDQVLTLGAADIEKANYEDKRNAKTGISFISGVGKHETGLVSILDLAALELDQEKKKEA